MRHYVNELPRSKLRGINSLQPLQNHAASCGELDPLFMIKVKSTKIVTTHWEVYMSILSRMLMLTIFCSLVLTGCVSGPYSTSGRVVVHDDHGMVDIVFSDQDREMIRDYYGYKYKPKQKHMPPGLAKKENLPPGLQKQLVRRGQLPPGLQYRSFPNNLERRLSRIPDDFARVIIDGSFVLFNKRTNVIFDVMLDL
jgi:hypothetical protein